MQILSSRRIGLAAIIIGVGLYTSVACLRMTRSVDPVVMPVSLAPGHVSTGEFHINAEGDYWIGIYTRRGSSEKCRIQDVLKANWAVAKNGKVFETGTYRGGWWIGGFHARRGTHKVDIEVTSDASCADAAEPRIEVASETVYRRYWDIQDAATAVAVPLVTIGLFLVAFSFRTHVAARKYYEEKIISDVCVQQPRVNSSVRFPLKRRILGLPPYGLVASVVIGSVFLTYWVLHSLLNTPDYHGIYVRITAPQPTVFSDAREGPVLVEIRRSNARVPELRVNSKRTEWMELRSILRAELSRRADRVVYVDGDPNLPYSDVVQVVDIAREAWPDVPVVLRSLD